MRLSVPNKLLPILIQMLKSQMILTAWFIPSEFSLFTHFTQLGNLLPGTITHLCDSLWRLPHASFRACARELRCYMKGNIKISQFASSEPGQICYCSPDISILCSGIVIFPWKNTFHCVHPEQYWLPPSCCPITAVYWIMSGTLSFSNMYITVPYIKFIKIA